MLWAYLSELFALLLLITEVPVCGSVLFRLHLSLLRPLPWRSHLLHNFLLLWVVLPPLLYLTVILLQRRPGPLLVGLNCFHVKQALRSLTAPLSPIWKGSSKPQRQL